MIPLSISSLIFFCELCNGRGWVLRGRKGLDWADPCKTCDGRGKYTFSELAYVLEEDPETLRRALELRNRPATSWRIFLKVTRRCLNPDPLRKRSPHSTGPALESGRQASFSS